MTPVTPDCEGVPPPDPHSSICQQLVGGGTPPGSPAAGPASNWDLVLTAIGVTPPSSLDLAAGPDSNWGTPPSSLDLAAEGGVSYRSYRGHMKILRLETDANE